MTPTLRVVLIVVSILTTFMIMRKIRQSKLQIEDSIFWLGFSSILIVFSIFPELAGTYTTANFIYLAVIFLLIVKMFHMSIKQSQLETKVKDLAQKIALDENERGKEAQTSVKKVVSQKNE